MARSSQIDIFTWINHTNSDPNADTACILNDLLWKNECRMLIHSIYSTQFEIQFLATLNCSFLLLIFVSVRNDSWPLNRIHWYSKFESIAQSSNFIRTKSSYKRKMFDHRFYFIWINRCNKWACLNFPITWITFIIFPFHTLNVYLMLCRHDENERKKEEQ